MSSYLASRLSEYGITPTAPINKFKWVDLDLGGAGQFCTYFSEHEQGIEINTPTVYGDRPNHLLRRKKSFVSRLRYENPLREDNGQIRKYAFTKKFQKGSEQDIKASWFFLPPRLYEAVKQEKKIQTLYLTEGEFKSFVPSMWGIDIAGIPGIHNFREFGKGPLLDAIVYIIDKCKVENVVIFYDSDMLDLSSKVGKNNRDADSRPRSFMKSAENCRRLLLSHGVNVYLGHIRTQPDGKYGLDDLFKVKETESRKDFEDRCTELASRLQIQFDRTYTGQLDRDDLFVFYDITEKRAYDPDKGASYTILPRIFKLDAIGTFYEYHRARQLKDFEEFRFRKILYNVRSGVPVQHDDNSRFYNPVSRMGNAYTVKDKEGYPDSISDFAIDLHYVIYVNAEDTRRIATLTNIQNQVRFTELRKEIFTSSQKFEEKIASWSCFNWFGTKKQLSYVKALCEYQEGVIEASMMTGLGWQEEEKVYSWANGVVKDGIFYEVNEYGIATPDGKSYCLPAFSQIRTFSEAYSEDRWMEYKPQGESKLTFDGWRDRMYEVFNTERDQNGTIAIMYGIFSLFSDIVFTDTKTSPLLFLTGIHRSGKNTLGEALMHMWGIPARPVHIKNITGTAANRMSAHIHNAIVWLDEWKNDVDKWRQEFVKSSYDRTGRTIAKFTNDDQIKRVKFNSPFMISGQDIPGFGASDPAIFSRGIALFFRKTAHTKEDVARLDELMGQLKRGMTHITASLLRHRKLIIEKFKDRFTKVRDALMDAGGGGMDARLVQNYTCILTPALILSDAGIIDLGKTEEFLIKICAEKIRHQNDMLAQNDELAMFWATIDTLFHMQDHNGNDSIRDKHEIRIEADRIYLRLDKIHERYARFCQKNNRPSLDRNTLKGYLTNHIAYKGTKHSMNFSGSFGRPLVFDRALLVEADNLVTKDEQEIREGKKEPENITESFVPAITPDIQSSETVELPF